MVHFNSWAVRKNNSDPNHWQVVAISDVLIICIACRSNPRLVCFVGQRASEWVRCDNSVSSAYAAVQSTGRSYDRTNKQVILQALEAFQRYRPSTSLYMSMGTTVCLSTYRHVQWVKYNTILAGFHVHVHTDRDTFSGGGMHWCGGTIIHSSIYPIIRTMT